MASPSGCHAAVPRASSEGSETLSLSFQDAFRGERGQLLDLKYEVRIMCIGKARTIADR